MELFGGAKGSCTRNLLASARQMYDALVRERDASFNLSSLSKLEPEVWEQIERIITGDPAITKCRECLKKFSSKYGEVTCSKQCKERHQAAQEGMMCHMCSKTCTRRMFYNPADKSFYHRDLLEQSEEELTRQHRPGIANFLIATKRKQNPIMFCSVGCEDKYFGRVVCVQCGDDEATTEVFPNIDTLIEVAAFWNKSNRKGLQEALDRADSQPILIRDMCKSCGAAVAPRHVGGCRLPNIAMTAAA